jgi:hypothetical protein
MVWFTADLHLGHGAFVKLWQRPFLSPEELKRAKDDPKERAGNNFPTSRELWDGTVVPRRE